MDNTLRLEKAKLRELHRLSWQRTVSQIPADAPGYSETEITEAIQEAVDERRQPFLKRLLPLRNLLKNWNSYGAVPVREENIEFVLQQLFPVLLASSLPVPAVIPTSTGGIQLEWHGLSYDLEVEIEKPGHIGLFLETEEGVEEWTSLSDFDKLTNFLAKVHNMR